MPSLAELSRAFAVQVIEPGAHKLIEEGAQRRRRWMDWAVFHVEPGFIDVWSRYARALKQRNAALRTAPDQAACVGRGSGRARASSSRTSRQRLHRTAPALLGRHTVSRAHRSRSRAALLPGLAADHSLAEALPWSRERDIATGHDAVRPASGRCVFAWRGGWPAKTLSRGQQKLVAAAMTLSQLSSDPRADRHLPTLLLDDPPPSWIAIACASLSPRFDRFAASSS